MVDKYPGRSLDCNEDTVHVRGARLHLDGERGLLCARRPVPLLEIGKTELQVRFLETAVDLEQLAGDEAARR